MSLKGKMAEAFVAGAEWQIDKSRWAGVKELEESAQGYSTEVLNEDNSRRDFEEMARVVYPDALARGRNQTHGSYNNTNLEKRWTGWRACDAFRAGVLPLPQEKRV